MSTADNVVRKAVTNLIASDDDLTTYNLEVSLPQNLTRLQGVTNITHIEEIPELVKHHNTLVRFDCVITDMFDEEFFVSTLPRVEPAGQFYAYKYHCEFDGV